MTLLLLGPLEREFLSGVKLGQEFFIKSADLESKIRQLLPSQGGLGAGQDLSASSQIVPIVDLTETAEGSNVRADLQTALSHKTCSVFSVANATTTIINTTGYFRIKGNAYVYDTTTVTRGNITISDGATTKVIFNIRGRGLDNQVIEYYDLIVFLPAGGSVIVDSTIANCFFNGTTRQIADIDGNLVNP